MSRTTLTDVARLAGVSTATVSRVLNGKSSVSEDTRTRVAAASRQLGIIVDSASSAGPLVAVTVPELANPTFTAFAHELSVQLSASGRHMLLCTTGPGGSSEPEYLTALLAAGVTSMISVAGTLVDEQTSHESLKEMLTAGMSAVFINGYDPSVAGSFFSTSDAAAVAVSVAHLRSLGHTRIGLAIGQLRYLPAKRKAAAFATEGLPTDSLVSTFFSVEGGQAAAAQLLDSGHTAIICASDIMALGAIREARSRGLQVPADVSIVGFDDSALMPFIDPPLTTVRQPVAAISKAAVDALLGTIAGLPQNSAEILFHPDLIIRQSTGPKL